MQTIALIIGIILLAIAARMIFALKSNVAFLTEQNKSLSASLAKATKKPAKKKVVKKKTNTKKKK